MQVLTTITCDLTAHERGIMPQISAVQYDQQTRDVRVLLLQNGSAWDVPHGTVGMVNVQKPDGTIAFYDADADGTAAVQMLGGNLLQVRLAAQALTAAGTAYVSVSLYNAGAEKLTTLKARLDIERSVVPEDAVMSSDYYSILTKEIAEVLAAAARTLGKVQIMGTYPTLEDLQAAVPDPAQGDIYNVGTEEPFTLYMWDTTQSPGAWIDQGPLRGPRGFTGNGIASTVLNADYTLTINYTDGGSYTTPPIRGEKGDTGNGITNAVLNADYTLTLTFADGNTYTTPPIRGEKGDTGNGIASTVFNADYTLTINYTDGGSYTTPSIRGATGNGIASTVLNADYTLTINYTDGTSYTTPPIRGETGPVYIPHMTPDGGGMYWTNNGGLPNPDPVTFSINALGLSLKNGMIHQAYRRTDA